MGFGVIHSFFLDQSVGWDEGVLGMQMGEVARLRVMLNFCSTFTVSDCYILFMSDRMYIILKFGHLVYCDDIWGKFFGTFISRLYFHWHISLVCYN